MTLERPQRQQLERMARNGDPRAKETLEQLARVQRVNTAMQQFKKAIDEQVAPAAKSMTEIARAFKIAPATTKRTPQTLNPMALEIIRNAGLPEPTTEHVFAPDRKFAFDFAWLEARVALEAEGMVHRTKQRFQSDVIKYNLALSMGWRVFRATRVTLESPDLLLEQLQAALLEKPRRRW